MKLPNLALAALFSAATAIGLAPAQSAADLENPDLCVSNIAMLDRDGDGWVENTEAPQIEQVEFNVDTDGDGYISASERVVACEEGVIDALEPNGPA